MSTKKIPDPPDLDTESEIIIEGKKTKTNYMQKCIKMAKEKGILLKICASQNLFFGKRYSAEGSISLVGTIFEFEGSSEIFKEIYEILEVM